MDQWVLWTNICYEKKNENWAWMNMESHITDTQWSEFIKVTTAVIETNPDPKFVETVAETLEADILPKYTVSIVWTTSYYGG